MNDAQCLRTPQDDASDGRKETERAVLDDLSCLKTTCFAVSSAVLIGKESFTTKETPVFHWACTVLHSCWVQIFQDDVLRLSSENSSGDLDARMGRSVC